jgi:glycosyltransferase involved in cell wall biosynthesis
MKTLSVFSIPSHDRPERTSGVDFVRIIQPMKYLDGFKTDDTEFKVDIFSSKAENKLDWEQAASRYKVFYFNYTASTWSYAAMGCFARKYGVKIVMDVDDALTYIRPDNPSYQVYKKGSKGAHDFTCILNDVDHVTVTNSYLKNVLLNDSAKAKEKISIFPNHIDLSLYKYRPEFKDNGQIRILFFGSTTHFIDLQENPFVEGMDRIMKTYPNVILKCVGAHVGKFKYKWGQRYEVGYGDVDIYKWIENKYPGFMEESDICIAPLSLDIYNKSKSDIKYLEYSAAKKPGCYQRIRQYEETIDDGVDGMLCGSADEWFEKLSQLIESSDLRRSMGQKAFEKVETRQIKDHVHKYANLFSSL